MEMDDTKDTKRRMKAGKKGSVEKEKKSVKVWQRVKWEHICVTVRKWEWYWGHHPSQFEGTISSVCLRFLPIPITITAGCNQVWDLAHPEQTIFPLLLYSVTLSLTHIHGVCTKAFEHMHADRNVLCEFLNANTFILQKCVTHKTQFPPACPATFPSQLGSNPG